MKWKKTLIYIFIIEMIIVSVIGFSVAQNNNFKIINFSEEKNICPFQSILNSNPLMISTNPCAPSGWWCTSNSDCCSNSCIDNVCN